MFNTNEGNPLIVYKGKETEEELREQLKHAEAMKNLLCKLTLPWDKYLPVIHKGALLYTARIPGSTSRNKVMELTEELIAAVALLSKSGPFIHHQAEYYNNRITRIERLLANE